MAVNAENIKSRIQILVTDKNVLEERFNRNETLLNELKEFNDELTRTKEITEKHYKELYARVPHTEKKLVEVLRPLVELEKKTEEHNRLSGNLIQRSVIYDSRINGLESMLCDAQDYTLRTQRSYADVSQKLLIREEMLTESDKIADSLEKKVRELEREKLIASNKLGSMKSSVTKSDSDQKNLVEKLKTLQEKIVQMEEKAKKAEIEVNQRQKEMGIVADELVLWKDRRNLLRYEMERMAAGMQEL